ncbi:unnamed protein product [Agarophyton chilense]|eukprot:gb/GEZJ01001509.1/.p1 GENE.gb/GEZJ01001509.1/~~gb/GEZJ01001509.1/.p1  ORF type:complete len:433 (-),score=21.45 gb/GEZJ01001509.1/:833-2131(-)
MAHTLASDKALVLREAEEVHISIIDPDQVTEILRKREELNRLSGGRGILQNFAGASTLLRKRNRSTSRPSEPPTRRLRTGLYSSTDIHHVQKKRSPLDLLTDDLMIEIFKHLPRFPHLLLVREVCQRWRALSCSPRLWTTLSFEGHEHVTSADLQALCKNTPSLRKLRKLSLARIHGVNDYAVKAIPRTECAATLQSVDLSWCSGATDKSVVEFSRCPGLRELRLSHCRNVTRRSVRILAVRCPRLEVLDMNCISGVRDSLLEVIGQNCPYLRVLNIANGRYVTDEGITSIANGCPRLQVLDLSWCSKVTDWSVTKIAAKMPNLRDVGLSETRVSDIGIAELTRCCSKLQVLHLARCMNVTNNSVDSIIRYCSKRLTSLNLASCSQVTDPYVEKLITMCQSLSCLDVSKLPCRTISEMLERFTTGRDIQVYF